MTQNSGENIIIVGARAVLLDLEKALSGYKRLENANKSLQTAQDRLAASNRREVETRRQVTAANQNAEATLARVRRKTAEDIAKVETNLQRARDRARRDANASDAARLRNSQRINDLEKQLESVRIGAAERRSAAGAALANTRARGEARLTEVLAAQGIAQRNLGQITGQTGAKLTAATAITGLFTRAQQAATGATRAFGTALIAMTGFSNRFAVALRFGLAAVTAFTAAMLTTQTAQFEASLTKINNLTELTTQETEQLGNAILEMSKKTPTSAADLGGAAYEVLSRSALSVSQTMEALDIINQTAVAGFADVKEVAIAVTSVINSYGKENITATQASEILFATVKAGGGEFNDYAQNIGRVAQLSRGLGVEFNEVGAALAFLTNTGVPANQATTALLGILNQIISPSDRAREAMEKYAGGVDNFRASIRDKGLIPALIEVLNAAEDQEQLLDDLFPEVRGLSGAYAIATNAAGEFARVSEVVNRSQGIIGQSVRNNADDFNFQVGILKNQVNATLIRLGREVLPTVTVAIRDLSKWLKDNEDAIVSMVKTGVNFAIDALNGATLVVGTFTKAIQAISAEKVAFVAAVTAMGTALALAFGPKSAGVTGIFLLLSAIGKVKEADNSVGGVINRTLTAAAGGALIGGAAGSAVAGVGAVPGAAFGAFAAGTASLVAGFRGADKKAKDFSETIREIQEETELAQQKLTQIPESLTNGAGASEELTEKIDDLIASFKEASLAAGRVDSATASFGQFAEVTKELADALQISAVEAGNIQGLDAIENAVRRADNEAFNFTKTLATVAIVAQQAEAGVAGAASALKQLVGALARSALDAARAAAQAIFSRPTREVANLNIQLANSRLNEAQRAASTNPTLDRLQRQLASLNRQSESSRRSQQASDRSRQQQERVRRQQADTQNDLAQRQLDQLRLQNLRQQIAFERINDNLERQIAATQFQASELNKEFLKSNEELQRQINEAIGRGDTGTALALTDQQQAAAKAYQSQADALRDNEQQLERQQRLLEFDERERQRAARLAEAEAEARANAVKSSQALTEQQDVQTESIRESNDALEEQKNKIQEQIDAITAQNDLASEQTARIQEQIDIYTAQSDILQAQLEAADKTLLTQQQQAEAAGILKERISNASQAVLEFSDSVFGFLPEFEESTKAYDLMMKSLEIVTNDGLQTTFISGGINPAASALENLTNKADSAIGSIGKLADAQAEGASKIDVATANMKRNIDNFAPTFKSLIQRSLSNLGAGQFSGVPRNARGGIYDSPTLIMVGETFQKELVLPLERPDRARELLARITPSLVAPILPNQQIITTEPATSRITLIAKDIDIADRKLGTLARASDKLGNSFNRLTNIAGAVATGAAGTGTGSGGSGTGPGIARIGTSANVGTGFNGAVGTGGTSTSSAAGIRPSTTTIPSGVVAAMGTGGGGSTIFAPSINVSGETLETMRTVVNREVDRQFRTATARSTRSGSLLSSGIGPSS